MVQTNSLVYNSIKLIYHFHNSVKLLSLVIFLYLRHSIMHLGLWIGMVIEFVANCVFLLYKCVYTPSLQTSDVREVVRVYLNLSVAFIWPVVAELAFFHRVGRWSIWSRANFSRVGLKANLILPICQVSDFGGNFENFCRDGI